ncbi:MAG: DUF4367 domain-containing protein [Lachnospiraceae bacterium]|nr:DUF4367 domain-containing protein [Ruminococcus sp.]MCM1276800.1 DUF4367 domain-containing protein [Lachnospiraceae bacterium]
MTFDEKIAQAIKETFEERTERLMRVEKKHRFSLAYRLWERKTLRDLRRNRFDKRWTLKRARKLIVSGMVSAALLVGGTAFAAVSLGRYGFVDKVDYSKLLLENHPSDKTTIEELYGLPEEDGWMLVDYDIVPLIGSTLTYQRGDIKVTLDQHIIHDGSMGQINTEKADVEMLSLYSENDGFVLEFENNTLLYWVYDGYLLEIYGVITKNEAINLALSTKIVDFPKNF